MATPATRPRLRVCETLEEMAASARAAAEAGTRGDDAGTRSAVDHVRQLRSNLAADLKAITERSDFSGSTDPITQRMRTALEAFRAAEVFISAWTRRFNDVLGADQILSLPDGPATFVDATIPLVWDWNLDLAVVHGTQASAIVANLRSRGQRRIVVLAPGKETAPALPDDVSCIRTRDDLIKPFETMSAQPPRRAVGLFLDSGNRSDELSKIIERIQTLVGRLQIGRNTVGHFASRWVRQGIENLPTIASYPNLAPLGERLRGKPVIIISPGPSLQKNIELVGRLKGRAILLAAAQTCPALVKAGIVPDIVLVIDPVDYVYYMDGLPYSEVEALVIGVSCHRNFYAQPFRRIFTFTANGPLDHWLAHTFGDPVYSFPGGSVAITALHIACLFRASPIAYVGQDLSFSDQPYIESPHNGRIQYSADGRLARIGDGEPFPVAHLPGYHGGTVPTSVAYWHFHSAIEDIAASVNAQEDPPALFNCTEGGAYIEGFQHIPLQEWAEKHLPAPDTPQAQLDMEAIFDVDFDATPRRKRLFQAVKSMQRTVEDTGELASSCLRLRRVTAKKPEAIARLGEKSRQLEDRLRGQSFVSLLAQKELDLLLHELESARDSTQVIERAQDLYALVEKVSADARHQIQRVLQQLKR
jgi:hypothetical protein